MKTFIRSCMSAFGMLLLIFMLMYSTTITSFAANEVTLAVNTRGDLQTVINDAGDTPTIILIPANFSFDGTPVSIPSGADITIRSEGDSSFTLTQTSGRHFSVTGRLTLEQIIFDGSTEGTSDTAAGGGVVVNASGSLVMNAGGAVQNCYNSDTGAGVRIENGGILTMNDGVISGNKAGYYGGGVYIVGEKDGGVSNTNGKMIMSNGTVSDNEAAQSGAGVQVEGVIEMSGGSISHNTANTSGEEANGGGGIFLEGAKAVLSGNSMIFGNTAQSGGGISVNPGFQTNARSTLSISDDAAITGNTATLHGGGGVYCFDDFIMDGGTISGNISSGSHGGGVFATRIVTGSGGIFTMNGGTISRNTSATNGGGVWTSPNGTVNITGADDTCYITDNSAGQDGGGIYNNGRLTVNNSEFSNNDAVNGGGIGNNGVNEVAASNCKFFDNDAISGGGIYNTGSFTVTDCEISNHDVADLGGGIYNDGTLLVTGSKISVNTGSMGGGAYNGGTLIVSGCEIIDNDVTDGGGGLYSNVTLNVTDSTIRDNTAILGGGIDNNAGTVTVNGCAIINNTASNGGGIYNDMFSTSTVISGGEISGNTALFRGGGIYNRTTFNVTGVEIIGNEAESGNGGGIFNMDVFEMSGGARIIDNTAQNGGGIYNGGTLNIPDGEFTNNKAHVDGGGIFTENRDSAGITTGESTVFGSNTASAPYFPPDNADALYPNIGYASVSIAGHPLNNYDINYTEGELLAYHITYEGNGGTGQHTGPDIAPGGTDTILSLADTGISNPGHTFSGWNNMADGTGTAYQPGEQIILDKHITLYAQWNLNEYTVAFESNGGTAIESRTVPYGETVTKPFDPTKEGHTFIGWYLDNETFADAWDFEMGTVTNDITLYAQWELDEYTVNFDSKGGTAVSSQTVLYGETVTKPADPVKEGYNFADWYLDNEIFTDVWDFETDTVTGNLALYAMWTEKTGQPEPPGPTEPSEPAEPSEPEGPSEPQNPAAPQTGDHHLIFWYLVIFFSSGIIVFYYSAARCRGRSREDGR